MTRPRKEQLQDLTTVHTPTAPYLTTSIINTGATVGTIISAPVGITNLIGGLDTSTSAEVIGTTIRPFGPLVLGDSLVINVDGVPFTINFAGTEDTIYTLSDKINTDVGFDIAFPIFDGELGSDGPKPVGRLRLRSPTIGISSSIQIVSGTLAKLGLVAGLTTGISAPVRGIITNGGYTSLKFANDRNFTSNIGEPLFIKLFHQSSTGNYLFKVLTSGFNLAKIASVSADYSSLVGESFFITVDSFLLATVTFTIEITQLAVVNTINNAFYTANPSVSDYAIVDGTGLSPFSFGGVNDLVIEVNGAGPTTISLTGDVSIADVVASINASFTDLAFDNGGKLKLTTGPLYSALTGVESFIKIVNTTTPDVLKQLGLAVGIYKPLTIAKRSTSFGSILSNEIKFIGNSSVLIVPNTPDCLKKLGFRPAGDSILSGSASEKEYAFGPDDINLLPVSPPAFLSVELVIPEVVEFHEIPINNNIITSKFEDSETSGVSVSTGLVDAGKTLLLNQFGQIDDSFLRNALNVNNDLLKKITRVISSTDVRLVTRGIETGGTLGNTQATSNEMSFDVDPGGDFVPPATAKWIWRINRETVPFTTLQLVERDTTVLNPPANHARLELTTTNAAFSNNFDAVRFIDDNLVTSLADSGGVIKLSQGTEGAKFLRIAERGPASATPPQAVSIFKSLNARYTITVGDGVNTFGDFNGANGIRLAIDFIQNVANFPPSTGVKIQVKRGTYIVTGAADQINISSGYYIEIEGMNRNNTVIVNKSGIFNFPAILVNTFGAALSVKNILFTNDTIEAVGIIATSASLELKNCHFGNQSIYHVNGASVIGLLASVNTPVFSAKNCSFAVVTTTQSPLVIVCNDGNQHYGYVFEDCGIDISTNDTPACQISGLGIVLPTAISGVYFNRCNIKLGSTTNNAGNLNGNCGALYIDSIFSGNFLLTITDVTWTDCRVRANALGTGNVSLLLYLKVSSSPVLNVTVSNITIRGGSWTCPAVDTLFTPFYIGNFNFNVVAGIGTVTIEDVLFGFTDAKDSPTGTSISHGNPPVELAVPLGAFFWAAYYVHAQTIKMHNVQFIGHTRQADSGDLYIYKPVRIDTKNVLFRNYATGIGNSGASFISAYRVRIEGSTTSSGGASPTDGASYLGSEGEVNSLILEGQSGVGNWVTDVANGGGIITVVPNGRLWLEKCAIHGFGNGVSTYQGISIPSALSGDNPRTLFGLTISNCSIYQCNVGIAYRHLGVAGEPAVKALRITNCNIQENSLPGIFISGAPAPAPAPAPLNDVIITNNIVRLNGTTGFPGIVYSPGLWIGGGSAVVMCNNECSDNNIAAINSQIFISGPLNSSSTGTFYGNVCTFGGILSNIQVTYAGPPSPVYLRGLETGYTIALPPITRDDSLMINGAAMMHNVADLIIP